MNEKKCNADGKMSKLVMILYIIAALMGVVFIFMLISSISYINTYTATYGMGFSDVWKDALQSIISSSVSYLIYGLVLVGIAKIIDMMQRNKAVEAVDEDTCCCGCECSDEEPEKETAEAEETPEEAEETAAEEPEQEKEESGEPADGEEKTEEAEEK